MSCPYFAYPSDFVCILAMRYAKPFMTSAYTLPAKSKNPAYGRHQLSRPMRIVLKQGWHQGEPINYYDDDKIDDNDNDDDLDDDDDYDDNDGNGVYFFINICFVRIYYLKLHYSD